MAGNFHRADLIDVAAVVANHLSIDRANKLNIHVSLPSLETALRLSLRIDWAQVRAHGC